MALVRGGQELQFDILHDFFEFGGKTGQNLVPKIVNLNQAH